MALKKYIEMVADFETTGYQQYLKDKYTRVYLWKCVSLDLKYQGFNTSISSYFQYLFDMQENTLTWFNNLKFDGSFIIDYLLRKGYKHKNTYVDWNEDPYDESDPPIYFTTVISDMGTIYSIELNYYARKMRFQCSYILMNSSIARLGKVVGIPKLTGTIDYDKYKYFKSIKEVPENEILYLDNDVEILRLAVIENNKLKMKGTTSSSQAFNTLKASVDDYKVYFPTIPMEEYKHVKRAYKGGWTYLNDKYRNVDITDTIRVYDYNSHYPARMMNDKMPIGCGEFLKGEELKIAENDGKLCVYGIYITKLKIKKGKHPFITKVNGVFNSETPFARTLEEFEKMTKPSQPDKRMLFTNTVELGQIRKYYDIDYLIVDGYAYDYKIGLYKAFVEKYKVIKENAAEGSYERMDAKLKLNGSYGKNGVNAFGKSKVPYLNEEHEVQFHTIETYMKYNYMPAAIFIIAWARYYIIEESQKLGDNFVYCDTDSIHSLIDCTDLFDIDPNRFGALKLERVSTSSKYIKRKCYILEGDKEHKYQKTAGIQADIDLKEFYRGNVISKARLQGKRVKGGLVLQPVNITL